MYTAKYCKKQDVFLCIPFQGVITYFSRLRRTKRSVTQLTQKRTNAVKFKNKKKKYPVIYNKILILFYNLKF